MTSLSEEIRCEPRVPGKYIYTYGEQILSFVFKYRPIG